MILNVTLPKKIIVPDNAITKTADWLCSSCGNKWTQYPIIKCCQKKKIDNQIKKETNKRTEKSRPN